MADWRQIQARIRKAKAAGDATAQLTELYERTRDAMVAFELAQWHEKAGDNAEATRWYTCAAERFRRAQWRTKAEEALTRLGAPIPVYTAEALIQPKSRESKTAKPQAAKTETEPSNSLDAPDSQPDSQQDFPALSTKTRNSGSEHAEREDTGSSDGAEPVNGEGKAESRAASSATSSTAEPGKKRRRRGRRGGRKRRPAGAGAPPAGKTLGVKASSSVTSSMASSSAGLSTASAPSSPSRVRDTGSMPVRSAPDRPASASEPDPDATSSAHEHSHESAAVTPSWQGRTRAGEPAIASRISQLESQLRRLLACPMASLNDADQAPAGPGVLLLSDSDQVTHYYIESCQTLRIGIGNLLRGGRGSKDGGLLKERMAENLGIPEARVSAYMKDHCAVRWLQLDEGAHDLAHFAIAVLRPVVNE